LSALRRFLPAALALSLAIGGCLADPSLGGTARTAGCGGVQTATAQHWKGSLPPLAIGDSTMLLALGDLSREGFDANARGCRQYPEALALMSALARAGHLPHLVAIALGANGQIEAGNVQEALRIMGPRRVLVLLTPRELGGGSGSDAQLVRAEGRRHGNRVVVLDWVAYSASHPSWFEPDGLHVNPAGAAGLARLIGTVLPIAAPPQSARAPRCPTPTPMPTPTPPPTPTTPAPTSAPTPSGPATGTPPAAGNDAPGTALHGIAIHSHGGVLSVPRTGRSLHILLANTNTFAVYGRALIETAGAGTHPVLATACVAVPQATSAELTIKLGHSPLTDAKLLKRFQVRLVLELHSPEHLRGRIVKSYVLRSGS
jgi:hypothetical protein